MENFENTIAMLAANPNLVKLIGDCPNIEMKTKGGQVFWTEIERKNGWVLQKNMFTGHARILDEYNLRKAWGSVPVMQEKFKRLTRKEFLEPGDIIGISRSKALDMYDHYAVYIGNGRVIHYAGESGDFNGKVSIHEAPINEFLKDDEKYFVLMFSDERNDIFTKIQSSTNFTFYDNVLVKSLCIKNKSDIKLYSPKETVKRAETRLGEAEYNLISNNCEHFAIWCKTGLSESYQVNRIMQLAAGGELFENADGKNDSQYFLT